MTSARLVEHSQHLMAFDPEEPFDAASRRGQGVKLLPGRRRHQAEEGEGGSGGLGLIAQSASFSPSFLSITSLLTASLFALFSFSTSRSRPASLHLFVRFNSAGTHKRALPRSSSQSNQKCLPRT